MYKIFLWLLPIRKSIKDWLNKPSVFFTLLALVAIGGLSIKGFGYVFMFMLLILCIIASSELASESKRKMQKRAGLHPQEWDKAVAGIRNVYIVALLIIVGEHLWIGFMSQGAHPEKLIIPALFCAIIPTGSFIHSFNVIATQRYKLP